MKCEQFFFFLDPCFFCYAQNIHIFNTGGKCSAYVLKYNFCTVFWIIEERLAPKVDVEEAETEMEMMEGNCQTKRVIRAGARKPALLKTAGVPPGGDSEM